METRTVTVDDERTVVVVPMPVKPDMVRFDPFQRVLHRLEFAPGDRMLRTQLAMADLVGRIEAAEALIKTGKYANIQAVLEAFVQEEFWGVRAEIATLLGNCNHAAAVDGLAQLIGVEDEPRVLVKLMTAAANYRSTAISLAVQARLQGGVGPQATQQAYIALGKQRDQAPYDRLVTVAHAARDWRIQSGAFLALAETRRHEALPLLRRYAAYGGSPNRARAHNRRPECAGFRRDCRSGHSNAVRDCRATRNGSFRHSPCRAVAAGSGARPSGAKGVSGPRPEGPAAFRRVIAR